MFTQEQAETLIRIMQNIAEAAIRDEEYKHSDWSGNAMFRAKEEALKELTKQEE
jgi:hypothetical protein